MKSITMGMMFMASAVKALRNQKIGARATQGLQTCTDEPNYAFTVPGAALSALTQIPGLPDMPFDCTVGSDGIFISGQKIMGKLCDGTGARPNNADGTGRWADLGMAGITFENSGLGSACCECGGGTSASVTGDPHVQNMAGQKFDIMALGRFSFLSLRRVFETTNDEKVLLSLDGTIDRVGGLCRQTFIQNVSIAGSWIREAGDFQEIGLRVAQSVPKSESLQIGFDGKWSTLSDLPMDAETLKKSIIAEASTKRIVLNVHGLVLGISVDQHNTWNFLDLNVQGANGLGNDVRIGGLLAHDDFREAVKAPDDCVIEKSAGPPFLSHMKLSEA